MHLEGVKASKLPKPIQSPKVDFFRRSRNGKKRRIAIRKKRLARAEIDKIAKRSQAEKEVAWKEKQTKKNRLKKLKKREKDKQIKAQAQALALSESAWTPTRVHLKPLSHQFDLSVHHEVKYLYMTQLTMGDWDKIGLPLISPERTPIISAFELVPAGR